MTDLADSRYNSRMRQKKPTAKEYMAIEHYIEFGDKVAAYRHAYSTDRMNDQTVRRKAYQTFGKPHVLDAIEAARADGAKRCGVTASHVLRRLELLDNFNPYKFNKRDDDGGSYWDLSEATADDWYCLTETCEFRSVRGVGPHQYTLEEIKVKPGSKTKVLDLMAKHTDVRAYVPAQGPSEGEAGTTLAEALVALARGLPD